jgi:hypothetical protein
MNPYLAVIPTADRCIDMRSLYSRLGRGPHRCPACHENGKWRQRLYKEQRPKMRALVDGPWRLIEPDPMSEVGYRVHACS